MSDGCVGVNPSRVAEPNFLRLEYRPIPGMTGPPPIPDSSPPWNLYVVGTGDFQDMEFQSGCVYIVSKDRIFLKTKDEEIDLLKTLHLQQKEIEELKQMVRSLWFMPGAPGSVGAQEGYEEKGEDYFEEQE